MLESERDVTTEKQPQKFNVAGFENEAGGHEPRNVGSILKVEKAWATIPP